MRCAVLSLRLDIAFAEQGNINIYEIYADVCVQDGANTHSSSGNHQQQQQQRSRAGRYQGALLGYSTVFSKGLPNEAAGKHK